jgi:hypothetical protein
MPKKRGHSKKHSSKARRIILSFAIAVVFAFFVGFAINTFYEPPQWDRYCPSDYKQYNNESACVSVGGKWTNYTDVNTAPVPVAKGNATINITGWCDNYFTCSQKYNDYQNVYDRNVFVICLIIGVVAIILGAFFLAVESVGSGAMGGGVLTIIYGVIRFWGQMSKYFRLIVLGLVLIVLIWIGYKKFRE